MTSVAQCHLVTVVTPLVVFHSFFPTRHTCLPQLNRHGIAVGSPVNFFDVDGLPATGALISVESLPAFPPRMRTSVSSNALTAHARLNSRKSMVYFCPRD